VPAPAKAALPIFNKRRRFMELSDYS